MNILDGVACARYSTVLQGLVLALHGAAAAVPCDIKRQPRPFRWTKTGEYRMQCLASQGHPSISGRGHQTMHTCAIENSELWWRRRDQQSYLSNMLSSTLFKWSCSPSCMCNRKP